MRLPPELLSPEDIIKQRQMQLCTFIIMTDTSSTDMDKAKCRKELRSIRKLAQQERQDAKSDIIKQFFIAIDKNWQDIYVSGYLPIASEIDILPLMESLRSKGAKILMPAIVAENAPLEFRLWDARTPLVKEAFGTEAPHADSPAHVPDVMCAPLLGFDEFAFRLGYGGGFYDRSIAAIRKSKPLIACGFAYDEQKIPAVPKDEHDMQLHAIITPTRFYSGANIG